MRRLVVVRHAEPLVSAATPPDRWPLSRRGRRDAADLGARLTERCAPAPVLVSPERKARETAALAFPTAAAHVRQDLGEVDRPRYDSSAEAADAVAEYLGGAPIAGWEPLDGVIGRLRELTASVDDAETMTVAVTHGLLITAWLHHAIRLDDPSQFWSELRLPDAFVVDLDDRSVERIE